MPFKTHNNFLPTPTYKAYEIYMHKNVMYWPVPHTTTAAEAEKFLPTSSIQAGTIYSVWTGVDTIMCWCLKKEK